jgi:hypothetical protein
MVAAPLRDGPPFTEAQLIGMSDCPSQRPAAMPRFLHGLTAIHALGALASTTREAPIAPGEPNDRAADEGAVTRPPGAARLTAGLLAMHPKARLRSGHVE